MVTLVYQGEREGLLNVKIKKVKHQILKICCQQSKMFVNTIFFLFWEKEVERNIFTVVIGFFTLYHDTIFISLEFVTDKSLLVRINHAFIFNKIDTGKN